MSKEGDESGRLCEKVALLTKVVQALNAKVEDAELSLSDERRSRTAALARAGAAACAALSAVSQRLDPAALVERYERVLFDIDREHADAREESKSDLAARASAFAAALEAHETGLKVSASVWKDEVRGAKNDLTKRETRILANRDAAVASANKARIAAERALSEIRELCAAKTCELLAERDAALSSAREAVEAAAADALRAKTHDEKTRQEYERREKQIKEDAASSLSAAIANHSAALEAAQTAAQELLRKQESAALLERERLASEIKTLGVQAAETLERHRLECAALTQSLREEAKSAEAAAAAASDARSLTAAANASAALRDAREEADNQISTLCGALEAEKNRVAVSTSLGETEKLKLINELAEERRSSKILSLRVYEHEIALCASSEGRTKAEAELAAVKAQLTTCSSDRVTLSECNSMLTSELNSTKARLAELEQLASKLAESECMVANLRAKLDTCEGREAQFDIERQALINSARDASATSLAIAESTISTLEAKVCDLSAQLEVSRAEAVSLRSSLTAAMDEEVLRRGEASAVFASLADAKRAFSVERDCADAVLAESKEEVLRLQSALESALSDIAGASQSADTKCARLQSIAHAAEQRLNAASTHAAQLRSAYDAEVAARLVAETRCTYGIESAIVARADADAARAQLEKCEVAFALEKSELERRIAYLEGERAASKNVQERAEAALKSSLLLLQAELLASCKDLATERTARTEVESAAAHSAKLLVTITEKARTDLAAAVANEEATLSDLRVLHAAELAGLKCSSALEEHKLHARYEDALARALTSKTAELDAQHRMDILTLSESASSHLTSSLALVRKEAVDQAAADAVAAREHEAAALENLRNYHASAFDNLRSAYEDDVTFLRAQCSAAVSAVKENADEQLKQAALEQQRLEAALQLSRPEDVVRIERLVALVKLKDDECKLFRLELVNRETNFNRVFCGGGQGSGGVALLGLQQAGLPLPSPPQAEPPLPGASDRVLAAGSGVRAASALQRVGSPRMRGGITEGRSPPPAPSLL